MKIEKKMKKAKFTIFNSNIFFLINLEVIKILRSKNFNLGFAKDISKFTILEKDIRKAKDLYKVYKCLEEWNLLESESFNVCKNTTVLIIVILDYLKVNMKVLDVGMENTVFDKYKKILESNRVANKALAIIQERTSFFYKYFIKFINLFA